MKKSKMMVASIAMATLGMYGIYTYSKKHPVKSKALVNDIKNIAKDLK